eukprot:TRINITY_DN20749_c0_g1_i1.p1 TRINITY_DN20749_c0_g1~~TRINITY_DN20749_c0_g1_i1.p1  ORF type:complete len:710 (+),score=96.37 TRINITY_DN20749_c0_g1_i1:418-2547(+)
MEDNTNSIPSPSTESEVLDVKPLRSLAPLFPTPLGFTTFSPPPFVCPSPFSAIPSGSTPFFPPSIPPESQGPANQNFHPTTFETPVQFRSPPSHTPKPVTGPANGDMGPSDGSESHDTDMQSTKNGGSMEHISAKSDGKNKRRPMHLSSYKTCDTELEDTIGKKQKRKPYKRVSSCYPSALSSPGDDDRESVERILMTFDALRRRLLQLEDAKGSSQGSQGKRPDLKAGKIMMTRGLRANMIKRIGSVPGVEIGDIFFFRFEMCLVGLHAPSMGGIDYMNAKFDVEEEPVAVSIVSSGGYDDDVGDADVLIYSGQGGNNQAYNKQINDQKLERGNLALQRSIHRGNEIRVIRGTKDLINPTNKIYIYDGIYKITESWMEKAKSGFSVFKYKLLRMPGQSDGYTIWKSIENWKRDPSSRGCVILPDVSSGIENLPITLVNDVDKEKGPAHFSYVTSVKHSKPLNSMKPLLGCKCNNVCNPADVDCCCSKRNGNDFPYSSNGLLVSRKPLIYECGSSCSCSLNCRNRVSQKGVRIRFEVFKTRDKGWGLRSWDPIRAGTFICEYTGEVIDRIKSEYEDEEDEYVFEAAQAGESSSEWNYIHELLGEERPVDLNETLNPLSTVISAKNSGNVSRFMNHSCSPNVFWQPIIHDHDDESYPHIMFFALKHIPPMTELTYDYGGSQYIKEEMWNGDGRRRKECLCGAPKCRGFFG